MSETVLQGNCHCGSYRFELPVADLKQTSTCACKHCSKAGCLWLPLSTELVYRATRDDGHIARYRSEGLEKEFCSVCGTTISAEHFEGSVRGRAVNVRCIRQINPFDYDVRPDFSQLHILPPQAPIAGSCDCGKVKVQLLQSPEELAIREDNCSICTRNAWVGAYPSKSQVVLTGTENTQDYSFDRKFNGFPFCKTCGIHVYQHLYGPPQAIIECMPEDRQQAVRQMLDIQPVNVRVLDNFVLSNHNVAREDEGTEGYESTVLGLPVAKG
ncbi:unnamed protein product [Zymoseptoria tritici ST99CH_3D1]|uniref:CENP-V/GFA domain-containing protein n=2 Tax=Zymoseptoria tritici TaxID=1047171 RepID=A0A1X7RUJ7_ZYMT9|nr:unnamed protein product [Zymoseptoria tritici ST99CH_3D7]SMR52969.1 unnamed protein product [Zymoseptoria tritici ST99CH_1E4]SMR54467.1 unnamed protein product [Zymoseptoria tritici ST99CH_3D1]